jgi:hypothetical protein
LVSIINIQNHLKFRICFAIVFLWVFYCIISSFQSLIFNYNGIRFKIPNGPISDKWTNYKDHINLVNPANKSDIIVVGTGLAGGSAAATLAELGYNVKAFF